MHAVYDPLTRPAFVGGYASKAFLLRAFLCMACAFPACVAAAGPSPAFTGNVQFMSNYVGRGLSQSVGQPSVEAELDYDPGHGVYAGLSGYTINVLDELYPGDSASLLIEGVIGYQRAFAQDSQWKLGIQRVQFPGRYIAQSSPMEEPNTTEVTGYVRWRWLSAKLDYAVTDYYGTFGSAGSWYADLNASQPVGESWTFGAHLGRKTLMGSDPVGGSANSRKDYTDYKLSLTCSFGPGLSFALAHTWTNANPAFYTVDGYDVGGHQTWLLVEKEW